MGKTPGGRTGAGRDARRTSSVAEPGYVTAGVCPLTERQLTFVRLCAEGIELTAAAREQFVTYSTARNHLQRARELTGARTNAQLVGICVGNNWLQAREQKVAMVPRQLYEDALRELEELRNRAA